MTLTATNPADSLECRVLDAIDIEHLLRTLADLVTIRSLCGQETPAQEYVAAFLNRLGLETDVWELDFKELRRHPAFGVEVERSKALGVVGIMGEDAGGQSLIWNGHVDVVPAGDEASWHYPPWQATIANGRVYGRGTCDMKGGLVCAQSERVLIDRRGKGVVYDHDSSHLMGCFRQPRRTMFLIWGDHGQTCSHS